MHIETKTLPNCVQIALNGIGHHAKDVEMEVCEKTQLNSCAFEGNRSFACAVNLATGERKTVHGSWGGANMFTKTIDDIEGDMAVPPGIVVIVGESGGRGCFPTVKVNPADAAKLLPPASVEELDEREGVALSIIKGIKSSYRGDSFRRAGLGSYDTRNELVASLIEKGFLKANNAASISITTAGKNAADKFRENHRSICNSL